MNHGLSDQVRAVATQKYVEPALQSGQPRFSIAARDLMRHLAPLGFPTNNWPQICTAIQTEKFLRAHNLEIEAVDGPAKKQSSTVVVRYRVRETPSSDVTQSPPASSPNIGAKETPSERALRLTEKLRGLLKEEMAAFGGGEAFLRWVRGYDDEDAR